MVEHALDMARAKVEVLGVMELYRETLCLVHYRASGRLPEWCACGSDATVAKKHTHVTHGIKPRRGGDELQPATAAGSDSLTRTDVAVYAGAVRRLLAELRTVEELTGTRVLCNAARE